MPNKLYGATAFGLPAFSILGSIHLLVFCCLVFTIAAVEVRCQTEGSGVTTLTTPQTPIGEASEGIQKGWNEFGVWGGISFDAPTLIGKTPEARFGNVGLRYGRVLAASKTLAFEWTIDAVPLAILSNDRFTLVPTGFGGLEVQKTRKNVYSAGLSPIGLKFNFRRQHRVQPFASSSGGFLYFREDVPVSGAKRFNLTYDFSGGIQIINSSRRAFTIGYKYQHLSNGGRSPINPGVDVQLVYAGFSIFK
ncbi:MAG: acyloxyacyl hydrolase [Acidobacteriota bacterium]|nr:acyloxyacyl hydrolase [Acidobacteriota bacterium]